MPALKDVSLLVALTVVSGLGITEARAAEDAAAPAWAADALQGATPDQVRIASDLERHYVFPVTFGLSAADGLGESADSTAIRSSVRNGEILEYKVTSLYYGDPNGGPQREVDSTVRYEKSGENWQLLDVRLNGTRVVAASNGQGTDC